MDEVIKYIEDNQGRLTMCIIYCLERKDHLEMKDTYKEIVFDVIDHPKMLALALNSCH